MDRAFECSTACHHKTLNVVQASPDFGTASTEVVKLSMNHNLSSSLQIEKIVVKHFDFLKKELEEIKFHAPSVIASKICDKKTEEPRTG